MNTFRANSMNYLLNEVAKLRQDKLVLDFLIANGLVREDLRIQTRLKVKHMLEQQRMEKQNGRRQYDSEW